MCINPQISLEKIPQGQMKRECNLLNLKHPALESNHVPFRKT